MPLNIQNKTFVSPDEPPEQTLHPPKPKRYFLKIRYFLLGFFIVLVVSSATFLIYILLINQEKLTTPGQEVVTEQPIESLQPTITQQPEAAVPQVEPPIAKPEIINIPSTLFTVYIAAYTIEPPATEEVSRWKEAGHLASVVESNKYYSVALGHYNTLAEARSFAEEMFEAFENGYWIGNTR